MKAIFTRGSDDGDGNIFGFVQVRERLDALLPLDLLLARVDGHHGLLPPQVALQNLVAELAPIGGRAHDGEPVRRQKVADERIHLPRVGSVDQKSD